MCGHRAPYASATLGSIMINDYFKDPGQLPVILSLQRPQCRILTPATQLCVIDRTASLLVIQSEIPNKTPIKASTILLGKIGNFKHCFPN